MANVLNLADADAGSQSAIVQRVRKAAARAQSLDPTEGRSIAALLSLQPTYGGVGGEGHRIAARIGARAARHRTADLSAHPVSDSHRPDR